jgi:hypothetical protein
MVVPRAAQVVPVEPAVLSVVQALVVLLVLALSEA